MRDQDKPFVAYRHAPGSLRLAPRNASGWRIMLLWSAMVVPIIGGFLAVLVSIEPRTTAFYVTLAAFVTAMAAWGVGGIVYMRTRAEIVDIDELLRPKREIERERQR
jgi:hypothetical protein